MDEVSQSKDSATTLFRLGQEILTNVARHANASHVYLTLKQTKYALRLEARDNGRGITEAQAKKLYRLEYALVKELVTFYDDPQMFVVAHILDTVYDHSEAWLVFDRYEGTEALKLLEPFKLKVLRA